MSIQESISEQLSLQRMKLYKTIAIIAFILTAVNTMAGSVDKGYKALYQFDYFTAKKKFTKALKYNESPGAQGLAIIFYRDDNPFHSYDSALIYIERSIATFDMVKQRKREKYAKYGFSKDSLYAIRQNVSAKFFERAKDTFTVLSFSRFVERHPWSVKVSRAIELRDSLAFFNAVQANTSKAFKYFMDNYPDSKYFELAKDNYYDVQFIESTGDGSLESFSEFIQNNPGSPLRAEAEKKEFQLSTLDNTPESYQAFIEKYPNNPYVKEAWWRWYQLELSEYSTDVIAFFLDSTDIPYQDELLEDRALFYETFLPYVSHGKFGFINHQGRVHIDAEFDFVSFFQEGLAIIAIGEKYGFINKRGEIQIACEFESVSDFSNGLAIVEKNGKFGMIDRNGVYIFETIYDDLGPLSEGFSYAMVSDRYGYYNVDGEMEIPHLFDDAYDFKGGIAQVEANGMQGYIDKQGNYKIPAIHETLQWYHDTLLVFSDSSRYGLMNLEGDIVVEPQYDWINPMKEGLAVAEIDDRLVYLDSSGVMVIDNGFSVYPNYELKGEFNNGVAIVVKKDKYGRINQWGKVVTDFKFDNLGLGQRVFPAEKDELWGLFDNKGKTIVSAKYNSIYSASGKSFVVNENDTLGVIDDLGNVLVPVSFDAVEPLKDSLFLVKSGNDLGVYKNEELIVPVRYDKISLFNEDYLFLSKNGTISYYDLIRGELIEVRE